MDYECLFESTRTSKRAHWETGILSLVRLTHALD